MPPAEPPADRPADAPAFAEAHDDAAAVRAAISAHDVLDEQMVAILREKSPAEKVAMIAAARRTALALAEAGVRYCHPGWSDEQIRREAVRRVSGAAR